MDAKERAGPQRSRSWGGWLPRAVLVTKAAAWGAFGTRIVSEAGWCSHEIAVAALLLI
jgi:hypothetical protein